MRFSILELKLIIDKGQKGMTTEEKIAFNILNFIHCIILNKQDFYSESFNSHLFGDLEMTFKKRSFCLIGHCQVIIKKEDRVIDYLFTQNGFELYQDVFTKQMEEKSERNECIDTSSINNPIKRIRKDTQHISPEVRIKLNKLAFYLSKFEHYDVFEENLNQGETIKKIADIIGVKVNTLKNKRDLYDPYCSATRVGWVQQLTLSDDMKEIYDLYKNKTKKEILEEIWKFI